MEKKTRATEYYKKNEPIIRSRLDETLGHKLNIEKTNFQIQNTQEYPDITELKIRFGKLFHENKTVKGIEVDFQLKPDAKLI